jgi:hypothetical protein
MKPKDMWTRLKQFIPSKSKNSCTSYLEIDNQAVTENDKIADIFNNFFCSIGHNLGKNFDNSFPEIEQLMPNSSFSIPKMSESFVKKEISGMCAAKATGLDNISVKLLKITSDEIVVNIYFKFFN